MILVKRRAECKSSSWTLWSFDLSVVGLAKRNESKSRIFGRSLGVATIPSFFEHIRIVRHQQCTIQQTSCRRLWLEWRYECGLALNPTSQSNSFIIDASSATIIVDIVSHVSICKYSNLASIWQPQPSPTMEPQTNGDDSRKRKTHKKSRKGCGNCKLRRVKVYYHINHQDK